jgi:hypothetical protein
MKVNPRVKTKKETSCFTVSRQLPEYENMK